MGLFNYYAADVTDYINAKEQGKLIRVYGYSKPRLDYSVVIASIDLMVHWDIFCLQWPVIMCAALVGKE